MKISELDSIPREFAKNHPDSMFIFTDNTDRTSGTTRITEGWYLEKYIDRAPLYYPSMTTAVVRGLSNAYPISTQHYYHGDRKGINGRWNDSDIIEFRSVINDEILTICKNANKYKKVYIPSGGLFDRHISDINKNRCPLIYTSLKDNWEFLIEYLKQL